MPRHVGTPRGTSRLHAKGMNVLYARQLEQLSRLALRMCVARSVEDRVRNVRAPRSVASVADDTRSPCASAKDSGMALWGLSV
jgi:hypothetical protein